MKSDHQWFEEIDELDGDGADVVVRKELLRPSDFDDNLQQNSQSTIEGRLMDLLEHDYLTSILILPRMI